jgi:hypothetical protein
MRSVPFVLAAVALFLAAGISPQTGMAPPAQAQGKPSISVVSPKNGDTITSIDIPVQVQVSNFKLSPEDVGLPDKDGEGHIHVMLDGMNMGVLFNFYTSPNFTLPGEAIKSGQHDLIFDLASNTHEDMEDTVTKLTINYQPTQAKPAPAPAPAAAKPEVKIVSPADGATVGPKFTVQVSKTNFNPSLDLEGKPNLAGFGHYHAFVDMDMEAMMQGMESGMMSMAGMVLMPGSDTFQLDLTAWPNGKHSLTVEPVQNDHTAIEGAKEATITFNLQGAAATGPAPQAHAQMAMPAQGRALPSSGEGEFGGPALLAALLGVVALGGGFLVRALVARRA